MKKIFISLITFCLSQFINAQLVTPFSIVKSVTQKGDITVAGNSILQCTNATTSCTNGRNEIAPAGLTHNGTSGIVMGYIDVDGSTGIGAQTFSSSSATLNMGGVGGCGVIFAYLTWGSLVGTGGTVTNFAKRDSIYLQVPGGSTYNKLKADFFTDNTAPYANTYTAYKDVTNLIKASGPGSYTAANIVSIAGGNNQFGGWSLVVLYGDNTKALRNLTIFRGLAGVSGSNAVEFGISGFYTPPSPAPVNVRLGIIAYDGDRAIPNYTLGTAGDSLKFNGVSVNNGKNPANDVFNSTITIDNNEITRNPSYTNTFGYDADIFTLNNVGNPYLTNSASSATLRISSGGETLLTDIVFTAIDVFEPDIRLEKSYVNISNPASPSAVPGDIIEFSITASNKGGDPADSLVVTDSLYGAGIYVPGSMKVTLGPNTGSKTDVIGDDQMDFDPVANVVKARLGVAANGTVGGKLKNTNPNDSISTFKFRVQISADCEIFKCKDSLFNMAFSTYKGETSQGRRTLYSAASGTDPITGCPLSGPVTVKIDVNPTCPPYADTTISACSPYNLSLLTPKRPGFTTFYNSSGVQVTQATTVGTYYAIRTIYPGFTWLPACKDSIVITYTDPCLLPISLLEFSAKYNTDKYVQLNWTTGQEINNASFEIERSIDGITFEKIGTIAGSINSNSIKTYSFDDNNYPKVTKIFYRLVQVDVNGAKKNSIIIYVNLSINKTSWFSINQIKPNPVKDVATINIFSEKNEKVSVVLFNSMGKQIYSSIELLKLGTNNIYLDLSNETNGLYLLEIKDNKENRIVSRIMK